MNGTGDKFSCSVQDQVQSWTFSHASTPQASEKSPLVNSKREYDKDASRDPLIRSGKELKRSFAFKHAFASIVCMLFGSGIFISPSLVARQTSNMGMALVVWVTAGIVSLFGALCFCELACMYKKAGSYYLFILEAYGEVAGFMIIWIEVIIIIPTCLSIIALTIGERAIDPFVSMDSYYRIWLVKVIAILSVVVATAINCVSASLVGKTQIYFSAIQSLSIIFLVVLGISRVVSGHIERYTVMFDNTNIISIGDFGLALYNALWAYDGWGTTPSLAEELKSLEKNLWLSIITAIPFVTFSYACVNLALMSALTRKEIINSETVATTFVAKVLGTNASYVMPIAVALSCFGAMFSVMFNFGRTILSAAREGQLPSMFYLIHKKRRTPIPALFYICVATIIWILPSSNALQGLITYFSIGVWLKYGLAIFSVLLMRIRRPNLGRPFKVWIANPIFMSLFSLFLVIVPFVKRPIESSVSLLVFLTALPVYYIFIKKHDSLPSCIQRVSHEMNAFLARKFNLLPCIFKEDTNSENEEDTKYAQSENSEF